MLPHPPRLAVRALILHHDRVLLVNAYPGAQSDLWCAPGGGVESGASLPDNLIREVAEETGLTVAVGDLALINEFHDPASGFHQVELFFHCTSTTDVLPEAQIDPEGVVNRWRWVTRSEMFALRFKPDSLPDAVWGRRGVIYDPLERIVP